jgi:hypothetical protein
MAENVSPPRSQPATPPELLGPTLDRSLVLEQHLSSTAIARLLHSLTPPSAPAVPLCAHRLPPVHVSLQLPHFRSRPLQRRGS